MTRTQLWLFIFTALVSPDENVVLTFCNANGLHLPARSDRFSDVHRVVVEIRVNFSDTIENTKNPPSGPFQGLTALPVGTGTGVQSRMMGFDSAPPYAT